MIDYLRLGAQWIGEVVRGARLRRVRRSPDDPFLVIGHRGSPLHAAENTLTSLQLALDEGANALEMDLCITADRQVVLWHDWDPTSLVANVRALGLEPQRRYIPRFPESDRLLRPVDELLLEELREHYGYIDSQHDNEPAGFEIPTFEDVVRWASGLPENRLRRLFLDVKIPAHRLDLVDDFCAVVNDVIHRYGMRIPVTVEGYHEELISAIGRQLPEAACAVDVEPPAGIVLEPERYSSVRVAIQRGFTQATLGRPLAVTAAPFTTHRRIVRHDCTLRDRHNATRDARRINRVVCYTINSRREMRTLIRMGVDGIQTDRPDRLFAVAKRERVI